MADEDFKIRKQQIIDSVIDKFEAKTFSNGAFRLPYRLHRPEHVHFSQSYPLIMMMHGTGGCGNDNREHLFVTALMKEHIDWDNCFVLAPQCPVNQKWITVDSWDGKGYDYSRLTPAMGAAMSILEFVLNYEPVDRRRCYIGGGSMGGYAAWELLARYSWLWAAGFPICGGGDVALAPQWAQIPVWTFHGAKDPTVPVSGTRKIVAALQALNAPVKYTEYPEAAHDAWTSALATEELYTWLFNQRRDSK